MNNPDKKKPSLKRPVKAPAAIHGVSESELLELAHKLGERVKELHCLYSTSQLFEDRNLSTEEILQGIVALIPPAWQYPEVTCARIKLQKKHFKTANFRETAWKQTEPININGKQMGTLEVYYLKEMPVSDEGPFLKEERNLIHVIAERTGLIVEHKQAEAGLETLYKQEKHLRHMLQIEMQGRIDFTRNLIHELKTPLTALVATSQLLLDEEKDKKLSKLARYVSEGANNLNIRIDELHDVIKGEIGKLKLDVKPLDLKRLLSDLVEETQALARQHNVEIHLTLIKPPLIVNADAVRVRQILLNLLNNAFKYAAEGGQVNIKSTVKSSYVTIEVQDKGPGIPEEDLEHLFEPGYLKANSYRSSGGLGIGLVFCKMLVELHGGTMRIKSERGSGSSFFFTLPLAKI